MSHESYSGGTLGQNQKFSRTIEIMKLSQKTQFLIFGKLSKNFNEIAFKEKAYASIRVTKRETFGSLFYKLWNCQKIRTYITTRAEKL